MSKKSFFLFSIFFQKNLYRQNLAKLLFLSFLLHVLFFLLSFNFYITVYPLKKVSPIKIVKLKLNKIIEKPKKVLMDIPPLKEHYFMNISTPLVAEISSIASDNSKKNKFPSNKPLQEGSTPFEEIKEKGNVFTPHYIKQEYRPSKTSIDSTFLEHSTELEILKIKTAKTAISHEKSMVVVKKNTKKYKVVFKRIREGENNPNSYALIFDKTAYYIKKDKYASYYKKIKHQVELLWLSWILSNTDIHKGMLEKPRVYITCDILPEGNVSNIQVYATDKDLFAAEKCLHLFISALPFPPFPPYIKEKKLPVYFSFFF